MDREGEKRGVKMNENREGQGEEARQNEESAGKRRRRGRLKQKELVVGKSFRKNNVTRGMRGHLFKS